MQSSDEAFADFLRASERDLRRTAYLLCGSGEDAEDAVQTAMYKVYLRWGRITRREAQWSYSRRAVVNAVINSGRRAWRREVGVDELPEVSSAETTNTVDDRLLLRLALQSLPARQRAVVVLRYVEELDVAETALVLSCPEGTVTSSAARALTTLRGYLTRAGVVRGASQKESSDE